MGLVWDFRVWRVWNLVTASTHFEAQGLGGLVKEAHGAGGPGSRPSLRAERKFRLNYRMQHSQQIHLPVCAKGPGLQLLHPMYRQPYL